MIRHNALRARTVGLLTAVSLLGAAVAMAPAYAAAAPAATQAAGHDAQMTPADQAKWAKKAKAQSKWHKSKTDTKWSASDKKTAK